MRHLRQHKRLWLLVLAVVTASLHWQAVYACSVTGEQLQPTCCCKDTNHACGGSESCDPGVSAIAKGCCEVSLSAGFDGEAASKPSAPQTKSGAPLLAPPPSVPAFPAVGAGMLAAHAAPAHGHPAPAIYLTTRRLRI